MKVIFTLLIAFNLFLAGTALSFTSPAYQKIAHSKFGRTVLDTIQMQMKSQTGTGADPRPQILELLKQISDGINQALQDADTNIRARRDKCANDQDQLNRNIGQLSDQIKADTKKQSDTVDTLAGLAAQQKAQQGLLNGYNEQLTSKIDARKSSQELYETQDKKLTQILLVLDTTKKYITDRLQARASGASFLETGTNALLKVRETVESPSFQMMSAGWGQLISFIATKALTKFKQNPDETAINGLQDIVDLINEIYSTTQTDKNNAALANNQEITDYEDAKSGLENSIALTNTALSSYKGLISTAQNDLNGVIEDLNTNNQLLKTKQKELDDNKDSCQKAEEEHTAFVGARNDELEVINEVTRIVNEDLSNLGERNEQRITA